MAKNVVIVESPAKARTLGKFLGKNYTLKASLGHVRDLPRSRIGVDINNAFEPRYVVSRDKSRIVKELKSAVEGAKDIYLATDPDREGEAISWHIFEVTKDKEDRKRYHRVVFHEITEEAIKEAFKHPGTLNMHLVDAQQARRVLDRLVGYKLSPLLWRKVRKGLSAGRVQSVAVRIIVEREREIQKFVPEEYWVIEAELTKKAKDTAFRAVLVGHFGGKKLEIHNGEEADRVQKQLKSAEYSVAKVAVKKVTRQPAPPFTTSTMQQEAWRKLRFSAKQTMAVAQQLYEGLPVGAEGEVGLITYMRTDSVYVAASAVAVTREFIRRKYDPEYVPANARAFRQTSRMAQEAHEAVRPTSVLREPSKIKKYLNTSQYKLYDLIWKRMVASQMAAAILDNTTIDVKAGCGDKTDYLLRTSTFVMKFPGFTTLYTESKDEEEEAEKGKLPELSKGDNLKLLGLFPDQRFTQPPPRFTEATLIKFLEQNGIGRPSTYAPILSTIQGREYVTKTKGVFEPTELGFLVNDLLVEHFPNVVDVDFTARLEGQLDEVAGDQRQWVDVVRDFYTPFEKTLEEAHEVAQKVRPADKEIGEECPECGKPIVVKLGRFGKFLACSGYPECKYTRPYVIKTGAICPECGGELVERISKKKRTFWGCSKYPKCRYVSFYRPLPRPCPQCSGLLTARGNQAKCTNCSYKANLEDAEGAEEVISGEKLSAVKKK